MAVDETDSSLPSERTLDGTSPTDSKLDKTHHGHTWNPTRTEERSRRRSSGRVSERRASLSLHRTQTTSGKHIWKFTLRPWHDDEEADWWFASTGIPLIAATLGPLANVLSIAALVTKWRMCLVTGLNSRDASTCTYDGAQDVLVPQLEGISFLDPRWCYWCNVGSLVVGFIGNFFLLCNFTQRIRYIVALPVTIIMWYIATGILIGITVAMEVYQPPIRPQQTYSQGFWYAVIAAGMYLTCSMLLMVNMLGYFLGHYPQHFQLTESQRTLILQTMMFFVWLAGGGAVFSFVEENYGNGDFNWEYVNALYFCDVTILTVGFGDLYATSNITRGLLFPYSVGGIIMLGLMVSSISKFATDLGSQNIIQRHVEHSRARTFDRTVTSSFELDRRQTLDPSHMPTISAPMDPVDRSRATVIQIADDKHPAFDKPPRTNTLKRVASLVVKPQRQRKSKLILLREEKDRFDAMRRIQKNTHKFKRWYALSLSITAFGLLWCGGAAVFWKAEHNVRIGGMDYFQALYFCWVSLLSIGYGDYAPQSNAGRPFFVFWSLIAVPTMTILVSDLGETVIKMYTQGTSKFSDFTLLPQKGVWRAIIDNHPQVSNWLQNRKNDKEAKHRLEEGFQPGLETDLPEQTLTIEQLADDKPSHSELARRLAKKIRQTANDLKSGHHKRYSYEEWVEYTQLIRFTATSPRAAEEDEEDLVDWDWIGEDSPMMSKQPEPEFVLDRLCESMQRYIRNPGGPDEDATVKPRPGELSRDTAGAESEDEIDPFDAKAVNSWRRKTERTPITTSASAVEKEIAAD